MKITISFISVMMFQYLSAQSTNFESFQSLPDTINFWEIATEDRIFERESLYDYIDGGAELFLSYGFDRVYNRIYSRKDQPDIFIDIFEMKSSYDAYGVFSQSREKIETQFGQESQYTKGAVLFWKDNFYVSIISSIETKESKETIFYLADIISKAIPLNGPKPQILDLLPELKLVETSIRYFRHHHWQNAYIFISYDNILNIKQNTNAVMAKYNYDKKNPILLIIDYPNEEDAEQAYTIFFDKHLLELKENRTAIDLGNNLVGIDLRGNILAIVFNSNNEAVINSMLNGIDK